MPVESLEERGINDESSSASECGQENKSDSEYFVSVMKRKVDKLSKDQEENQVKRGHRSLKDNPYTILNLQISSHYDIHTKCFNY